MIGLNRSLKRRLCFFWLAELHIEKAEIFVVVSELWLNGDVFFQLCLSFRIGVAFKVSPSQKIMHQRKIRFRCSSRLKLFQCLVGVVSRQPRLPSVQMELRSILSDCNHLG